MGDNNAFSVSIVASLIGAENAGSQDVIIDLFDVVRGACVPALTLVVASASVQSSAVHYNGLIAQAAPTDVSERNSGAAPHGRALILLSYPRRGR